MRVCVCVVVVVVVVVGLTMVHDTLQPEHTGNMCSRLSKAGLTCQLYDCKLSQIRMSFSSNLQGTRVKSVTLYVGLKQDLEVI